MPQQFAQNPLNQFEPEKLPVGWPWRLFSASFVVFLTALLIYLGLVVGYEPYLNSRIQQKEAEIQNLAQTVSNEDRDKFIGFYSKLDNLKNILDSHVFSSKIFPQLEKITNQKVFYSGASLKVSARELQVDGVAENYGVLGEQLESFSQLKEVERYILDQSRAEEGVVRFKATLILKDTLIK
ncbi:MAG: hypothetical protein AAB674_00485 [Patescibacteria group bacterium]